MDVLRSILGKEVLKAASSAALMSRRLVFASNVRSLILWMFLVCLSLWAMVWTGVIIFARRTSVVWILLRSLLLRLDRLDMLVSGCV